MKSKEKTSSPHSFLLTHLKLTILANSGIIFLNQLYFLTSEELHSLKSLKLEYYV